MGREEEEEEEGERVGGWVDGSMRTDLPAVVGKDPIASLKKGEVARRQPILPLEIAWVGWVGGWVGWTDGSYIGGSGGGKEEELYYLYHS